MCTLVVCIDYLSIANYRVEITTLNMISIIIRFFTLRPMSHKKAQLGFTKNSNERITINKTSKRAIYYRVNYT